jgi:tetratricopeptide (TPR) repeat protein
VPWNQVWRTGAGKCTRIFFERPVKVQGQPIPAGAFSVFTIPTPEEWVVIINADTTLYGHYNYDRKKDLARFSVSAQYTERFYETLTFDIDLVSSNAKMYMSWAHTQIAIDIETTTDDEIKRFIQTELLTGTSKTSNTYAGAASYLYFQGEDFAQALKLADKALQLNSENTWVYNTKISIYEKMKLYDEALHTINQAIEGVKQRSYPSEKERLVDIEAYATRYAYFEALKN